MEMVAKGFGFGERQDHDPNTEHQSFTERMGSALVGVCCGIFVFLAGLGVCWWNEGRYVAQQCVIEMAAEQHVTATCAYDAKFDGKLTFSSCSIDKDNSLMDIAYPKLEYSGRGLQYSSEVMQFQNIETKSSSSKKDKTGGGKTTTNTFSYSTGWQLSKAPPYENKNTGELPAANPAIFPDALNGWKGKSPNVIYGEGDKGYKLTGSLVDNASKDAQAVGGQLSCTFQSRPGSTDIVRTGAGGRRLLQATTPTTTTTTNGATTPTTTTTGNGATTPATTNSGTDAQKYTGGTCNVQYNSGEKAFVSYSGQPAVGDIKLQLKVSQPVEEMTIMMQQTKEKGFTTWESDNPSCRGAKFGPWAVEGKKTPEQIIEMAHDQNTMIAYILRILTFFMVWCGLQCCCGPCALMPDIVPFIGPMIGDLVGTMLLCATCMVGFMLWCIVFAVAWIRYRPMIGIPLLAAGVLAGCAVAGWQFMQHSKKGIKSKAIQMA